MKKNQKDSIKERAEAAARKFCVKGCCGNYPTCTRCHEPHAGLQCGKMPQIGKSTVCPLAVYEVPDQAQPTTLKEQAAAAPTANDCVAMCANCEHARVTSYDAVKGTMSVELIDYKTHCIDCPVFQTKEAIQENQAEARLS